MAKNYFDIIDRWHQIAEKNINKDINAHLNFMRNDVIKKNLLSKEDIDMYINSLLSDSVCKKGITEWYEMKDKEDEEVIIPAEMKLKPSFWLKERKNNPVEMEKINNIRKWFLNQKNNNSYQKNSDYKNKPEYEESYKSKVKWFDTRDVALNQILEFAIRDLLEGSLQSLKWNDWIENIRVIKTNEYDDVSSKTDFIIEFEYANKNTYSAFDLTVSNNSQYIEKKQYPIKVFCPNFHFNKKMKYAIPRSLIILDDKEFVFKYLKKYMQQIQITWEIEPNDSLKIVDAIWYNKDVIKDNILSQLLSNLSKN